MPGQWYVMREGKEHGPLDKNEIKSMARKGQIQAQTKVRLEGKGWVAAAKVKGLLAKGGTRSHSRKHGRKPAPKPMVLVQAEAGPQEIPLEKLERLIDQDRIPFDRPVVSIDGGATWLRPAEALIAVEQGLEVQGMGDPSSFDAFADTKIKVYEQEHHAVSAQQQHALIRPWQGFALGWIAIYFLPHWIDMRDTWLSWNIAEAGEGGWAAAGGLGLLFLILGVAIFPITRWAQGILRGVLMAVTGAIGLLATAVVLFFMDHAASALTADLLPGLLFISAVVLSVMAAGNFLRSYFPGNEIARMLSGIPGIIYVLLALGTAVKHLGGGWFGFPLDEQPFVMWITSVALWGMLGLTGLAGVLSAAGLASRAEGAEVKANLAHVWATRAVLLFLLWLAIAPIWVYGSGLTSPDGMGFMPFLFIELGILRAIICVGGAFFLLSSGIIDAAREHLLQVDGARKAEAIKAAKAQRRPAS